MSKNVSDVAKLDSAAPTTACNLSTWIDLRASLAGLINDGPQRSGPRWDTAIVDAILPLLEAAPDPFSKLARRLITLMDGAAESVLCETAILAATSQLASHLRANQKILALISAFKRDGSCRDELISYYQVQLPIDRINVEEFAQVSLRAVLLAHYVQSASGYLSVLAAYVSIADELGLPVAQARSSAHSLLDQLDSEMGAFADQAIAIAMYGQRQIISNNQNACRTERPTWSDYNDYRTDTTIAALDLISLWPYFHPQRYPTGTSIRNTHRKLLTLWYTDPEKSPTALFRGNIEQLEHAFHAPSPVGLLDEATFTSATYVVPVQKEPGCFSGLRQAACTRRSIDGFAVDAVGPVTGPELPQLGEIQVNKETVQFDLRETTFLAVADFWNGRFPIYWNGSSFNAEKVLSNFSWYSKSAIYPDEYARASSSFSPLQEKQSPDAVSTLSGSIPRVPVDMLTLHPALFTHQLVDFQVLYDAELSSHDYLLGWRDETVRHNLLPLKNHVMDGSTSNPIEQFHAITAAQSIARQSLEIIAGPGFTGGDLVVLRAGSSIDFRLMQDKEYGRWFAGRYKVRLWFVKPAENVNIAVMIQPANGLSSKVAAVIPAAEAVANLTDLRFKDLVSFEFEHDVLIVTSFDQVTLSVMNLSLASSLVLDRVELMFHSVASDPA
jgi:hypothetical protein